MEENEVSEELVIDEPRTPARIVGGIPYFEQYLMLAERISKTAMVPSNLRNRPDEVLAVVMYGAELGIGPMQALQQINFIAGKPSASAELLRALVLEAGHQFILETNREVATASCKRKDWDEWRQTSFTIDDALTAGLLHKSDSGWAKYPDQMLGARATSKACRMWFADVISGMSYTPEEVVAFSRGEVEPTASDEAHEKLRTAISALAPEEIETLKAQWKEAEIPPLDKGLTITQIEAVLSMANEILNTVTIDIDDVVDAEIVGTEAAETLEKTFEFAPEAERFAQ